MRRLTVPVDDENLYRAVQEEAAREGRQVKDIIAEVLEAWLRNRHLLDTVARQQRQDALLRSDELRMRQPVQASIDESLQAIREGRM